MKMPDNGIEPELQKELEILRSVPARDSKMAARGRARFLSEAMHLRSEMSMGVMQQLRGWLGAVSIRYNAGYSLRQISIAGIITFAFIISGVSLTANAAQGALPGEALYGVKLTLENVYVL